MFVQQVQPVRIDISPEIHLVLRENAELAVQHDIFHLLEPQLGRLIENYSHGSLIRMLDDEDDGLFEVCLGAAEEHGVSKKDATWLGSGD